MDDKHLGILLEVKESLGSLHSKVDNHTSSLEKHEEEDDEAHKNITSRLGSLEETRTKVLGAWLVLLFAVGIVSSLVTMLAHAWTGK